MGRGIVLLFCFLAAPFFAAASESVVVGAFSKGDLTGWKTQIFHAETRYQFSETDQGQALKAEASASASGLIKKLNIDLTQTPCLSWRWKVNGALLGLDETTKAGDDYAARVYIVVSTGPLFWQTHAISYVWSGSQDVGAVWPNAYTDKATTVALQSGDERAGQWTMETRNLLRDVRRFIGPDITTADAVALMTDTDDSKSEATAYYGDILLGQSCD